MAGRRVDPERERAFLELVASGMTPNTAAGIAGVSVAFAYGLDRKVNGVARLPARREAMAARAAGRAAGPGRAKVAPGRERALLDLVASGMPAYKAAGIAGVSVSFAYGLVRKMGGVHQVPDEPRSGRYLSREERREIARLRESGLSMRQVAARMGRSPSSVSRELRRNAGPGAGGCQPERAHRLARERQRRPKLAKISCSPALRAAVQGIPAAGTHPGRPAGG